MICRDPEVQLACFTPDDILLSPVSVMHVTVFQANGKSKASYYKDANDVTIDPTTFLGGGSFTFGACQVTQSVFSDREVCIDTGVEIITGYAVVEITSTSTNVIRLEDQAGAVVTGTITDCDCACDP